MWVSTVCAVVPTPGHTSRGSYLVVVVARGERLLPLREEEPEVREELAAVVARQLGAQAVDGDGESEQEGERERERERERVRASERGRGWHQLRAQAVDGDVESE
jgi:hypothetical protein